MANVIEIVLKATDKTGGKLDKIGGSLANVGKIAATAVVAGVAVAGAAIVGFGVKAVMAGADAEEMMSKLGATFGDASKDMIENLDEFATATGRSRFELRGAATDMGAVIKALGGTEEEAAGMSASMTMLAADLGAFNNMPTADVAHKIQSALTGEFESLKSLGVVINQAKLNQELLNMGVEGGTKAATEYQKAMAVQNILMQQTTDAQGAAAKESDSFTGQMVKLKAALSDATTEIGMKLIPVVTPLIAKFAKFAADVLPKVVVWVGDKLVPALIEVGKWLGEHVPVAIAKISTFWTTKLRPFLVNAKIGFDAIVGIVRAVIIVIGRMVDRFKAIKLPSWLTPGSPTPFEMGIRGIGDALKSVSGTDLPQFQMALASTGTPGGSTSEPAFNFYDTNINNGQDIRNLAYEVAELMKG